MLPEPPNNYKTKHIKKQRRRVPQSRLVDKTSALFMEVAPALFNWVSTDDPCASRYCFYVVGAVGFHFDKENPIQYTPKFEMWTSVHPKSRNPELQNKNKTTEHWPILQAEVDNPYVLT